MYSVKRLLTCLAVLSAAFGVAPALAAAPTAELRSFTCQTSSDPASRQVAITAVMRPRPGTQHMELKFELLRRTAGRFHAVHGKGLGMWLRPSPPDLGQRSGDVWRYNKPVLDLPAPAVYRFRVTFRWDLASSHTDVPLWTPTCSQS